VVPLVASARAGRVTWSALHVRVLLNDSAATRARTGAAGDVRGRLRDAFAAVGVEAHVRMVAGAHLADAAHDALACGPDAVVAAGGDGTVSAVASALAGTHTPLGVLPLGTLNHFAKDLGIPLALDQATRTVANRRVRAVDVGDVNGQVFINNGSIGMYPHVVGAREELRRRLGHGKWVAMALAIVSVFRRSPTVDVRIIAGERESVRRKMPFVFVGNNRYDVTLLAIGRRERLDRGELSLYFSRRAGRTAVLRLALRALLGRLEQDRDFESMTLREFWIDTRRRHLHVAIDGEVRTLLPPLHFRCRPRALNVLVPAR